MSLRQQILYLWLAEGALDTEVVAWAFHDGARAEGPALPEGQPPYSTGVAALEDGWMLLQSPGPMGVQRGAEYDTGPLANEFVFERRIEIAD